MKANKHQKCHNSLHCKCKLDVISTKPLNVWLFPEHFPLKTKDLQGFRHEFQAVPCGPEVGFLHFQMIYSASLVQPFQGRKWFGFLSPRALPWANVSTPSGHANLFSAYPPRSLRLRVSSFDLICDICLICEICGSDNLYASIYFHLAPRFIFAILPAKYVHCAPEKPLLKTPMFFRGSISTW